MRLKILFIFISCLVLLAVIVPVVSAQKLGGMHDQDDNGMMHKQVASGEGKMRACQAREASIKNRMTHLAQLATSMEENFDRHASRVEDYYNNKIVPSGKTVVNYDSLVGAIATQKTAVQTALTTAQNDASAFSCTIGTPKEQMMTFKDDMRAVKNALKDYRMAIKDLIVAVRSVTGSENKTNPTEKP